MKRLQKSFLVFVLTIFAFSSVASSAVAACDCSHMEAAQGMDHMNMDQSPSSEMPCHGMDKTEKTAQHDSKNGSEKDLAKCDGCGCGHCNITTPAALPGQVSQQQFMPPAKLIIAVSDPIESLLLYGIDYPPKRIS
jgi:hypothetical protein